MKKIILAFLLCASGAVSAASATLGALGNLPFTSRSDKAEVHGTIGIAALNRDTFDGIDDDETIAVPLIYLDYKNIFFIDYNKLGVWLWKPDGTEFKLGLAASLRPGYDKGDGPILDEEIDETFLYGVRAKWHNEPFLIDGAFYDSAESDSGAEMYVKAAYMFVRQHNYTLSGFVRVEALTDDVIDYFYYTAGKSSRDGTGADNAVNFSLGLVGTYAVYKRWMLTAAAFHMFLDSDIDDAPNVTEDTTSKFLFGISYNF